MLIIKLTTATAERCVNWELDVPGEQAPFPITGDQVRQVWEVQANGMELQMLMEHFPRLPWPRFNKRWSDEGSIRFFDETARFIVGNLPAVVRLQ
jgi:hypothetical protein